MEILPGACREAAPPLLRSGAPRWRHLYTGAHCGIRIVWISSDRLHACEMPQRLYDAIELMCGLWRIVLVDVASFGYFQPDLGAQNPINKVIAFEAAPRPGVLLAEKRRADGLTAASLFSSARSRAAGIMHSIKGLTRYRLGGLSLASEGHSIEVEVRRLTPFARHNDRPLKIDVEGADTWVLLGAEDCWGEKRIRQSSRAEFSTHAAARDRATAARISEPHRLQDRAPAGRDRTSSTGLRNRHDRLRNATPARVNVSGILTNPPTRRGGRSIPCRPRLQSPRMERAAIEEPEARAVPLLLIGGCGCHVGAVNGAMRYYMAGLARECQLSKPNP